ncbi:MAG TPA: hypothetical protein VKP65_17090, partial [Rhodothermales bacterium]|nr:hypothetical protein [Rhodothermales bacterium]
MAQGDGVQANGQEAAKKGKPQRTTGQKIARGLLIGIGSLVGVVISLVLLLLLILQTNFGAARIGDAVIGLANPFDEAQIEIGDIDGNWLTTLKLYDVNIIRTDTLNADFAASDTVRMLHADTLELRYRLLSLLSGKIHVRNAYAAGLDVKIQQQADSTWDLLQFAGQDTTTKRVDTTGNAFTFEVDHIRLHRADLAARFYPPERDSTLRIADLRAQVDSLLIGDQIALDLNTLLAEVTPPTSDETMDVYAHAALRDGILSVDSLRLDSPSTSLTAIGTLALPTDLRDEFHDIDFRLDAEPLAFRDIAPFVPALDPTGSATMDVRVQGSSQRLEATAEGRFSDGATLDLDATISPANADSLTYQINGEVRNFNPAFFTGNPTMAGNINADVQADLQGTALETLDGTAQALLFNSRYSEYAFDRSVMDVRFDNGAARIDLNTGLRGAGLALNGTITPFAETPTYDLRGSLRNFDLGRFSEGETGQGSTQSSDINTTFRLQGTGFDPQTANLTANLDFAPSRVNNYNINEGSLTARLRNGDLNFDTRLTFPEGLIAARGDATFGEELRYRISEGR